MSIRATMRSNLTNPRTLVGVGVAAALGFAAGAIWDWFNWHPMDAIVLTLGAIPVVVVGLLLSIFGTRRTGRIAPIGLALGAGMLLGQVLGASRPNLDQSQGLATVSLTSPNATEGSGIADCAVSDGTELQVGVDQNLRLDIVPDDPNAPADVDQREFFGASIRVGDRWRDRAVTRSDNVNLWIVVGSVRADVPESELVANDASTVDIDWTNDGGTISFADLVPAGAGTPFDLQGTITWTC